MLGLSTVPVNKVALLSVGVFMQHEEEKQDEDGDQGLACPPIVQFHGCGVVQHQIFEARVT
jgi:hypothetical protein